MSGSPAGKGVNLPVLPPPLVPIFVQKPFEFRDPFRKRPYLLFLLSPYFVRSEPLFSLSFSLFFFWGAQIIQGEP